MSTPEAPQRFDNARYREVMGHYPTGVVVVTARTEEVGPVGMVVGTFTSVSLEPPLIAFLPRTESGTYALMREASAYCVNVLAHDQQDVCRTMATPGPGAFDRVAWHESPWGAPMLDGVVAHIHCRPIEEVTRGDHHIVLCEVDDMAVLRAVTPLLFFQGGYGGFATRSMTAMTDANLISAVRLAEVARPHIERLAREFRCEAGVLVASHEDHLITAASAFGGDTEMNEALGERIPLIPPVGEAYVAFSTPEIAEEWLARSSSKDPELIEEYRRRLEAVRTKGWSMLRRNRPGEASYLQLMEALREYSDGVHTPARERAVREVIEDASHLFEVVTLDDEETYDVGGLIVPVHNPDGTVSLVIRLMQLPRNVSGAQVRVWIAALKGAASKVEERLAEPTSTTPLDDYLHWFHTEFPM